MTTERIEIDPTVMMGKPVIRGTRITVELILRKLAEGTSEVDLLEDYPHLTTDDVRAAVAYGAASVAHEEVVLLPNEPLADRDLRFCKPLKNSGRACKPESSSALVFSITSVESTKAVCQRRQFCQLRQVLFTLMAQFSQGRYDL